MKYVTMTEINALKNLIEAKQQHIAYLQRVVAQIRSSYKSMTNSQLAEALRDVHGMLAQVESEKAWIARARIKIDEFYKPAIAA